MKLWLILLLRKRLAGSKFNIGAIFQEKALQKSVLCIIVVSFGLLLHLLVYLWVYLGNVSANFKSKKKRLKESFIYIFIFLQKCYFCDLICLFFNEIICWIKDNLIPYFQDLNDFNYRSKCIYHPILKSSSKGLKKNKQTNKNLAKFCNKEYVFKNVVLWNDPHEMYISPLFSFIFTKVKWFKIKISNE